MTLELIAPAKLNLTLEVLGKRNDGYHEVVSLMQTIELADHISLALAGRIELEARGEQAGGLPEDPARNLAYRAAEALAQAAGRSGPGAHIVLEKRIPAGGLGGGSSDAAAVLRGLDRLWGLDLSMEALSKVAATLGSDVTFFLHGGAALARGHGERVEPLANPAPRELTLFVPSVEIEEKTHRMYGVLTPDDYSTGHRTREAVEALLKPEGVRHEDLINVFLPHAGHLAALGPSIARCHEAGVHVSLTGAGPCFFSLQPFEDVPQTLIRELERDGIKTMAVRTLNRLAATAVREA